MVLQVQRERGVEARISQNSTTYDPRTDLKTTGTGKEPPKLRPL